MSREGPSHKRQFAVTAMHDLAMWGLRVTMGWLFLYEGLHKLLLSDGWTAATYLRHAKSPIAGFYQWMANNETVLGIVDPLNVWGLIAVGTCLILGLVTRAAALSGALLLLLYYLAYPPLIESNDMAGYGHYLLVNPNLIMIVALLAICMRPACMFGLDAYLPACKWLGKRRTAKASAVRGSHEPDSEPTASAAAVGTALKRRQMIAALAGLPVLALFGATFSRKRTFLVIRAAQEGLDVDAVTGPTETTAWPKTVDRSESAPSLPVAITRCPSYEADELRTALDRAFDLVGGLQDLVRGMKVTVKINSTGLGKTCCGLPPGRSYQTHPDFIAALCAALSDAGAKRIAIVESFYFAEPTEEALTRAGYDLSRIQSAGGHRVEFVNTRNRGTQRSYRQFDVPEGGLQFPAYHLHAAYADTDVFVSLAKLKQHGEAGITCAAKNLFGITPQALYGSDAPNEYSLMSRVKILHRGTRPVPSGVPTWHDYWIPPEAKISTYRVPRIITDLVRARPIDLAIVDGIQTIAGGAGPWDSNSRALKPGVIIVGRNVVCTDTVCAAVMGFDSADEHGSGIFPGENHIQHMAQAGVGTNRIEQIEVCGLPVAEALTPFSDVSVSATSQGEFSHYRGEA